VLAVAESHRGSVMLERTDDGAGARFVVRLPAQEVSEPEAAAGRQTSTTTGRTIGRRRSLS
jgi:hypothetical protein